MTEPTRDQMLALCNRAGVTPEEIIDHPEYGLCLSMAALYKLGKLAPGSLQSGRLMEELANIGAEMEERGDGE